MNTNLRLIDNVSDSYKGVDRRSKPRIYDPFPTTVRGVDADGEAFESEAVLDNLGAGGLYLRLPRRVEPGAKLDFIIRLSPITTNGAGAARVMMQGVVLRAESRPCDSCGVAVGAMNYHFL